MVVCVGENINIMSKTIGPAIKEKRSDPILEMARHEEKVGIDLLDLNIGPSRGNMFNDLNWGGYISLQLWPAQRPFIDSLADTTGDVTRQYETVITLGEGWEEIIQMYDIAQIIVPTQSALARELISQGWRIVYQDEVAIILVAP